MDAVVGGEGVRPGEPGDGRVDGDGARADDDRVVGDDVIAAVGGSDV
jgi:hypothetical protein